MKRVIVLTGGGTAGHVMPHLALLPKLSNDFIIHYIGSADGIEKKIMANYPNITYHEVPAVKLERRLTLKNLKIPFGLIGAIWRARKVLKKIAPDVIFSKGGFVAVAPAVAGGMLKIPVISHESDYSMGLANKVIYKVSKKMCFSFADLAKKHKKGVWSGSPIRPQIFKGNKSKTLARHNLSPNLPCLLVMGGSLGAVAINSVVHRALSTLVKSYNVIHIVGEKNISPDVKHANYVQIGYTNQIEDYLACADIIVSRAGSNAIFEFLALNKPMILIPLPKAASRGDQLLNGRYFKAKGYAEVIEQQALTPQLLIKTVQHTLANKGRYINNMKIKTAANAADIIMDEIVKACRELH